jgi:hypothetical protein
MKIKNAREQGHGVLKHDDIVVSHLAATRPATAFWSRMLQTPFG